MKNKKFAPNEGRISAWIPGLYVIETNDGMGVIGGWDLYRLLITDKNERLSLRVLQLTDMKHMPCGMSHLALDVDPESEITPIRDKVFIYFRGTQYSIPRGDLVALVDEKLSEIPLSFVPRPSDIQVKSSGCNATTGTT